MDTPYTGSKDRIMHKTVDKAQLKSPLWLSFSHAKGKSLNLLFYSFHS